MAQENVTISFTTTQIAEFNNFTQGTIGPASTVFYDIVNENNIGPASTIDSDISSLNKVGPASTVFADIAQKNKVGPANTIFADIAQTNKVGPANTIFVDLAILNKVGPAAGINTVGLESIIIQSDIIYYSNIGQIKIDELILDNNLIFRGNNLSEVIDIRSKKYNVIEEQTDRILNIDESSSICFNTSSSSESVWSLPENTGPGITFTFVRTSSSGNMIVNTLNNNYTIMDNSGTTSSGIILNSVGSKLSVISSGTNGWITYNSQNIILA